MLSILGDCSPCQCSSWRPGLILLQITWGLKDIGRRLTWLTCVLLFTRSSLSSLCAFHSTWMFSHPYLRIHSAQYFCNYYTPCSIHSSGKKIHSVNIGIMKPSFFTCPLGKKKSCLEDCSNFISKNFSKAFFLILWKMVSRWRRSE